MITSKSPRKVLKLAHELATRVLPAHASHFSRKDFTQAQLFACLVLREHQKTIRRQGGGARVGRANRRVG